MTNKDSALDVSVELDKLTQIMLGLMNVDHYLSRQSKRGFVDRIFQNDKDLPSLAMMVDIVRKARTNVEHQRIVLQEELKKR